MKKKIIKLLTCIFCHRVLLATKLLQVKSNKISSIRIRRKKCNWGAKDSVVHGGCKYSVQVSMSCTGTWHQPTGILTYWDNEGGRPGNKHISIQYNHA